MNKTTTTTVLDSNLQLIKHPTNKVMRNKLNIMGIKPLLTVLNKIAKSTGEHEALDGRPTVAINMGVLYNLMPNAFKKKHADQPNYATNLLPNLLRLLCLSGAISLLGWTELSKPARDDRLKQAMASKRKVSASGNKPDYWYMNFKNVYAINDLSQSLNWGRLSYKMNDHTKLTYGAVACAYDLDTASDIFAGLNATRYTAITDDNVTKLLTQLDKFKAMTLDDCKSALNPRTKDGKTPGNDWYRDNLNCLDMLGYFKSHGIEYNSYCKVSDYVQLDGAKPNTKVLFMLDVIK